MKALLESLQPRIRVYGVGGAGCNAINRLFEEDLFESEYVTGYAINTDAQALLMSPIKNKVLIGRTARGRGAGGDPTKGEVISDELWIESVWLLKIQQELIDLCIIQSRLCDVTHKLDFPD